MTSLPFEVGDFIRIKHSYSIVWDYNKFHNPATEGNRFLVTDVDLVNNRFKIDGFRGYNTWWPFETANDVFESCETHSTEIKILKRINKLYAKCKTTAHWSK
jgi:hypothetical protein